MVASESPRRTTRVVVSGSVLPLVVVAVQELDERDVEPARAADVRPDRTGRTFCLSALIKPMNGKSVRLSVSPCTVHTGGRPFLRSMRVELNDLSVCRRTSRLSAGNSVESKKSWSVSSRLPPPPKRQHRRIRRDVVRRAGGWSVFHVDGLGDRVCVRIEHHLDRRGARRLNRQLTWRHCRTPMRSRSISRRRANRLPTCSAIQSMWTSAAWRDTLSIGVEGAAVVERDAGPAGAVCDELVDVSA